MMEPFKKLQVRAPGWLRGSASHLAQVMISRFVGSGPTSGSVLTAQRLEPVSESVSPPPSAPPMLMLCLSLSLNNKYTF